MGSAVDEKLLHPGCVCSAQEIHNKPAAIAEEIKQRYPGLIIDLDYAAFSPDAGRHYKWGSFEDHGAQEERMGGFVKAISARSEGETVLCISHGGPCNGLYRHMLQCSKDDRVPSCGFTGLYLYKQIQEAEGVSHWEAPIAGDQTHLQNLSDAGEATGRNDAAEQGGALF
jgi:hypothetical protein